MSERQKIEERLRKKEIEIQGLEEKIKTTRVYVQALRDILKMLSPEAPGESPAAEAILRSGSAVAQARDVILKRCEPVHINELIELQGKKPTRENRASLTSSLSAYVRRGEIFTRPAPNTFGLMELGHHSLDDGGNGEPPEGFGQISQSAQTGTGPDSSSEDDDDEIPF